MTKPVSASLGKLETRLGYQFRNAELLTLALTHRSLSKAKNYERLEFLGDALLGVVIAERLYQLFPDEKEGRLTRMRATLVRQATLSDVAIDLKLGQYLLLGLGEIKAGGRQRTSILADVVEALIGAIYLDSNNFKTVQTLVQTWFANQLNCIGETVVLKDAKSRLQELLQAQGLPLPSYELIKTEGKAPNEVFHVRCCVNEKHSKGVQATGQSRRIAEQKVAKLMLDRLIG